MGLGVGLAPFEVVLLDEDVVPPASSAGLYLPIDIGPSFRLEPEIGILRYTESARLDGVESGVALTNLRVGAGFLYRAALGENGQGYVGPRLALVLHSEEKRSPNGEDDRTSTTTKSRSDFVLGLVGGGEYFFTPSFSLGAEAQLGMRFLGDTTTEREPAPDGPPSDADTSGFVLETRSLFFARVFFF